MSESKRSVLAKWVDDRIEAYVDGGLTGEERARLEAFVRTDRHAAEQLRLARLLHERLSNFEAPTCPPEITQAVLAQIRTEALGSAASRPDANAAADGIRPEESAADRERPNRSTADRERPNRSTADRPRPDRGAAVGGFKPNRGPAERLRSIRNTAGGFQTGRGHRKSMQSRQSPAETFRGLFRPGLAGLPKAFRTPSFAAAWETYLKPSLAAGLLVAVVVASALAGRDAASPPIAAIETAPPSDVETAPIAETETAPPLAESEKAPPLTEGGAVPSIIEESTRSIADNETVPVPDESKAAVPNEGNVEQPLENEVPPIADRNVTSPNTGRDGAPPNDASSEEVQRALDDAKWAIAFLSDLGRDTGQSIRRDVLQRHVADPVQKALDTAFDDSPSG